MQQYSVEEKNEYNSLLKSIIDLFKLKNLTITCASYEGYDSCKKIDGFEPDVRGFDTNSQLSYIGEAKLQKDFETDRDNTKRKFQALASNAMAKGNSEGKRIQFYISVPESCKQTLVDSLAEWDLLKKDNVHIV